MTLRLTNNENGGALILVLIAILTLSIGAASYLKLYGAWSQEAKMNSQLEELRLIAVAKSDQFGQQIFEDIRTQSSAGKVDAISASYLQNLSKTILHKAISTPEERVNPGLFETRFQIIRCNEPDPATNGQTQRPCTFDSAILPKQFQTRTTISNRLTGMITSVTVDGQIAPAPLSDFAAVVSASDKPINFSGAKIDGNVGYFFKDKNADYARLGFVPTAWCEKGSSGTACRQLQYPNGVPDPVPVPDPSATFTGIVSTNLANESQFKFYDIESFVLAGQHWNKGPGQTHRLCSDYPHPNSCEDVPNGILPKFEKGVNWNADASITEIFNNYKSQKASITRSIACSHSGSVCSDKFTLKMSYDATHGCKVEILNGPSKVSEFQPQKNDVIFIPGETRLLGGDSEPHIAKACSDTLYLVENKLIIGASVEKAGTGSGNSIFYTYNDAVVNGSTKLRNGKTIAQQRMDGDYVNSANPSDAVSLRLDASFIAASEKGSSGEIIRESSFRIEKSEVYPKTADNKIPAVKLGIFESTGLFVSAQSMPSRYQFRATSQSPWNWDGFERVMKAPNFSAGIPSALNFATNLAVRWIVTSRSQTDYRPQDVM